jgi:3-dehydroquinate dehydratase-2
LNLLGTREPEIYGHQTFEQFLDILREKFDKQLEIEYFQSNEEGAIINKLHEVGFSYDGILLNAGGYTHTSIAIGDAVSSIKTAVIEVHISNVHARESFRGHSYLSPNCKGIIVGFGLRGYELGLYSFI